MEKIYITAHYRLKPDGCIKSFRTFITECIHTVARSCPDTLEYYWYENTPKREFVMRGKFVDSDAVGHQLNCQRDRVLKMQEHADIEVKLFGDIDDSTRHQYSMFNLDVFNFCSGISKENGAVKKRVV